MRRLRKYQFGFVGGKTEVSNVPAPLTENQKEIQQLQLDKLRRDEAQDQQLQAGREQAIRDLTDEQAVRSGGKVSDVMRDVEGAEPQKSLEQFVAELRESGRFTTPARPAEYQGREGELSFAGSPATTDEAALGKEAQRLFGRQAPTSEIDPEATAQRQKYYEDIFARETTAQARTDRQAEIAAEISELQLADIKRGGAATPEQLALIGEATAAAQKTGEADIERFRTDTLRQINEEVASASGLRPTDTPIVRLSERAGEESARQQGMLTSRLAETNATARLNFPLAQSQLTSSMGAAQQSLGLAAQSFQQQLNQRAIDNRFRLFAGSSAFGGAGSGLGFGAQGSNQSSSRDPTIGEVGQLAGGIGALMTAGSSTAAPSAAGWMTAAEITSDRRLKKDIFRIGELPSGIPVYIFKFIGYEDYHVGCMADEILEVIPEAVSVGEGGYYMVRYDLLH